MFDVLADVVCVVVAIWILIIAFRMVKIMKRIAESRYRNCDITLDEDQFREIMDFLYLFNEDNKK